MAAFVATPDSRLSPSVRSVNSDIDPFNLSPSTRHRYSSFDTQLFSSYNKVSPTQAKRALEASLADTERRIHDASNLGSTLLDQRSELEARLKDVESRQAASSAASSPLAPELTQKLLELQKANNDIGRETARQFIPKKPRTSSGIGEVASGPDVYSANGRPSPSKPSVGSPRKPRNGASSHAHDIEFATEISTSLLAQVRALQSALAEKEDGLRRATAENTNLQADAEILNLRLRGLDEHEQQIKDENWQLELQNQRLLGEIKDAAGREQRLNHSINTARAGQSTAEKEYDALRTNHDKLTDEHNMLRKQLDAEVMNMHRNLSARESEADKLQKRLDELSAQNHDLLKAAAYRNRMDQEDADAAAGASPDPDMLDPSTPDASPPASPVKATPRHGALESETLKSSLHHAHKMIQNLKNNIHREKTEKIELKKMLQDARDELEARRADGGGGTAPGAGAKKRTGANQGPPKAGARIDRLGGSRNALDEVINDPSWENYDDSPIKPRAGNRRDPYDLSTDASDAFETANENDSMETETEGFQTGFETLPGDSEEELTETEDTQTSRARQTTLARLTGANRVRSFQSTASDDADYFNPSSPPSNRARQKLRAIRGGQFQAEDVRDSPVSVNSDAARTQPAHNLASELADFGGDDSSVAASTPARYRESEASTPNTFVRDVTPPARSDGNREPPSVELSDKGTMTEPWLTQETTGTSAVMQSESALHGPRLTEQVGPVNQLSRLDMSFPRLHANDETSQMIPRPLEPSRSFSQLRSEQVQSTQSAQPFAMSNMVTQSTEPVRPAYTLPDQARTPQLLANMLPASDLAQSAPQSTSSTTSPMRSRPDQPSDSSAANSTTASAHSVSNLTMSASAAISQLHGNTHEERGQSQNLPAKSSRPEAVTTMLSDQLGNHSLPVPKAVAPSMAFVDDLMKHPPPVPDSTDAQARSLRDVSATRDDVSGERHAALEVENAVPLKTALGEVKPRQLPDQSLPLSLANNADLTLITLKTINDQQPASRRSQDIQPAEVPLQLRRSQSKEHIPDQSSMPGEPLHNANTRQPFRTVSGNAPVLYREFSERSEVEAGQANLSKSEGKRKATSNDQPEGVALEGPRRELTPILSLGAASPSRTTRTSSLTARFSTEPATYIEPADFGASERPLSPGSSQRSPTLSSLYGPPLPNGHREVIAAASRGPTPLSAMNPPQMPPSSWRGASQNRPRTPNSVTQPGGVLPTTMPPQSRSASFGRPDASHRSSRSSFGSEVEGRFVNYAPGSRGDYSSEDITLQNADPRMIQAITQTMIGEFLWKYTRKAGRDEHSAKRHRRFFWIHPYTRTLYWSNQDPSHAGKTELKAKSVGIEAVRVVTDDSVNPPGLCNKSIVVVTPGRSIKFTAPTAQRHETWFNALSYLLLRTPATDSSNASATMDRQQRYGTAHSASATASSSNLAPTNTASASTSSRTRPGHNRSDTQSSINSDDVSEFNPSMIPRPRSANPQASALSLTSRRSQSATGFNRAPEPHITRVAEEQVQPSTSAVTNQDRYIQNGLIPQHATTPPTEPHPSTRQSLDADANPPRPSDSSAGAAPAPNIPTITAKHITGDYEQVSRRGNDGFKKPAVPPSRGSATTTTSGLHNNANTTMNAGDAGHSKRGRMGSFTDRLSFFSRGRSRSKSRGRESTVNGHVDPRSTPVDNVPAIPPPNAMYQGNTQGHNHSHAASAAGDETTLENVRACCDGKHDVSSLDHRSHRQSSRSRSRTGAGDAQSLRGRHGEAGSLSSNSNLRGAAQMQAVPSLTRDIR